MMPVAPELLAAIAALAPLQPALPTPRRFTTSGEPFDLDRWIEEHRLDVREPRPWQGGRRWIFNVCPWNPEHRDHSAYIVQFANGALAAGCHHNSCQGQGWRELRALVEGPPARGMRGGGATLTTQGQATDAEASEARDVEPGLCWRGRSHGRAYLRRGKVRYTVTPEGEGYRVRVTAGSGREGIEVTLDGDDAEAAATRVAGALNLAVAEVAADLADIPAELAAHAETAAPTPPTAPQSLADFATWVRARLNESATRAVKELVTETLVDWLLATDALIFDAGCQPPMPYLLDEGRLVALDAAGDALFVQAALARAGLNPAEPAYQWLYHRLRTAAAAEGKQLTVRRFSFHDGATVYISCGPRGYVVARAGQPLEWRSNGANDIIFAADAVLPEWDWRTQPCHPLRLAAFRPALAAPPEAPAYTAQVQSDLLAVFLAALLANVRPLPLAAALGNKGGGKSTLARAIVRVCYGPAGGVAPLGDDPRDFWTLAQERLVFALDNIDAHPAAWLPDALAVVATGGRRQGRLMYTQDAVADREIRAAVVVTSRTAPFARPDVAERILPLTTQEFTDAGRAADSDLDREIDASRAGVLVYLARAAADLLAWLPQAPDGLPARFQDFARLTWAWHAATGRPEQVVPALIAWRQAQALAVGDADPLLRVITEYTPVAGFVRKTATDIVRALADAGADLPHIGGRKAIAGRLRELKASLGLAGWRLEEHPDKTGGRLFFSITRLRPEE